MMTKVMSTHRYSNRPTPNRVVPRAMPIAIGVEKKKE